MNAIATKDSLQIHYKDRVASRPGHWIGPSNLLGVATVASVSFSAFAESAKQVPAPQVKNVVLLRCAFGDAPRWGKVIKILQGNGYNAAAVQIPLTSLADDVVANATPSSLALSDAAATVRRSDDARASVFNSRISSVFANFNNLKSCAAATYVKSHRPLILLARWLHYR